MIDLQKEVVEFENELESDPEDEVLDLGDVLEKIIEDPDSTQEDNVDAVAEHEEIVAFRHFRDAFSVVFGLSLTQASDEELEEPIEDQPLPVDALPTSLSLGYIANSDPEEDEKDSEEDPADYPADGGDNDDNESSDDDNDDDDVVKEEEDKEEEEHLTLADPSAILIDDLVPSS
ncbi:hypothetical protein Tco_0686340 [Tanacetum coccineum]